MIKRILVFLTLFLTACSPMLSVQPTITPTPIANKSGNDVEIDSSATDMQLNISDVEYVLTAAFHYEIPRNRTNIMYTYQIPFSVLSNGQLEPSGESLGFAIGDAGVHIDDCVETQPVTLEYTFEFLGQMMDISVEQIDPGILMADPDSISGDEMRVFDLALVTPEITSFEMEPYQICLDGEEMDMEFVQSLLSLTLNIVKDLPPQYRTIPALSGTFCPSPITWTEVAGSLTPCYTIEITE